MKINLRWVSTYLVTLCWLVPLACLTPSLFQAYGRVISIMLILMIITCHFEFYGYTCFQVELKDYTQTCTIVALEGEGF